LSFCHVPDYTSGGFFFFYPLVLSQSEIAG
jgi:hypothetical protein